MILSHTNELMDLHQMASVNTPMLGEQLVGVAPKLPSVGCGAGADGGLVAYVPSRGSSSG